MQNIQKLTSTANLANTYWNQGRWNGAEQLEISVIGMTKKLLGADHPDILTCVENLAYIYREQGRICELEIWKLELEVMNIKI